MQSRTTQLEVPGDARNRIVIWVLALTFAALFFWASKASLDEIVRGPGNVAPASQTQVIQSLEGGILAEVLVSEGEVVEAGDVLARLDETRFAGAFKELESQVIALEAQLWRLERELAREAVLALPEIIAVNAPQVAQSETQLFRARGSDHASRLSSLSEALSLQQEEVNLLEGLAADDLVPEIEVLRARQALSQINADLREIETEYELDRAQKYAETRTELTQLRANLAVREDQLSRTSLTAPTRAIVNTVSITTIGGVVAPGDPILELTPLDDDLRVEVEISPQDIAFVTQDMLVTVKLTAYDYTIYGSLTGRVIHVSSDTFEDETRQNAMPYYRVIVAVDEQALSKSGDRIEIRPGMVADVELHVGTKTVLEYLLKPLFKTTEAFREP